MRSARALVLSFGVYALVACEAASPADEASPPIAKEPTDGTSCDAPTRYVVALSSGTCTDVSAPTGLWQAGPALADAPGEVQASFCELSWSGAAAPTEADRDAVRALDGAQSTVAVSCTESESEPVESEIVSGGVGGVVGCDVCKLNGMVRGRLLFAVLPARAAPGPNPVAFLHTLDGVKALVGFTPKTTSQSLVVVRLPTSMQFREERVSVE